ncbi:MAG: nitric-oxide reductase large subunit, partial [Bacteroidota bacterium]|nr:nitric-oxide reductase large subunit [Bacteroidota bacterium]
MDTKRLWIGFTVVMVVSFAVLGYFGREIYRKAPPIPDRVVTTSGKVLFTREDIQDGQNVWQSIGGQQLGTIWGHGAYQAP